MYSLRRKLYTNYTQTIHSNPTRTLHKTLHKTPQRACTETLHRTLHGNPLASKTIQPGRLYCECRGQRPRTAAPLAQKPYTEPCTATRWQARLSSLEGCTVSNRGQRPRTASPPQCQPGRLYAREDGGGSRSAAGALHFSRAHRKFYVAEKEKPFVGSGA